ncbi:hypothetical protein DSAG12_01719 [Promethearchaeum syntrophicum]|uniref:Uncharacterized protein n=1 Tax=Promethearchaeum syntrophicum TaxID=2594042 RepID=A0A5B9D9W3_9ARCH|nr:hypothetical protein [Candidatus Prometheoarchaeum syntrophicum]QEE15892.1 hypothetical protein DSAG12_01719 [Candidatus Prometheoarchaeum syntrophicum]
MESKPEFILPKQTNTKGSYQFSAIMSLVWIMMIVLTILKGDFSDPVSINGYIVLHVFNGSIVILPVVFGFLRRDLALVFKVDEQNGALILESQWGNYFTFTKSYPLNDIKGFEVHNVYANKKGSMHGVTQNQLLSLCFQSRRPKHLTNFLDNENSTEFAQNLNKFLAENTQIPIGIQAESVTPYTPKSQQALITIYCVATCVVLVVAIVVAIIILNT